MTTMEWNHRLDIGVEILDNAHKKLFSILRRMIRLQEDPGNHELLCREGIKFFKNYTLQHFAQEEAYMQSIGYSGYETHKRLHDNMRDRTLPALEQELMDSDYSSDSVQHFMGIVMAWLTQHIMLEDRALSGKVRVTPIHTPPENIMQELDHAFSEIIHTILGLKTQIVSECYRGEDVGEMSYCRLNYISSSQKPLVVYLGFEEPLILAAASEMMGAAVKQINKMSLSAVRLLSRSVMKNLGRHFSYVDACQLKKENLIPKELMQKVFQNACPAVSMLYRTSKGYLVFSIQM